MTNKNISPIRYSTHKGTKNLINSLPDLCETLKLVISSGFRSCTRRVYTVRVMRTCFGANIDRISPSLDRGASHSNYCPNLKLTAFFWIAPDTLLSYLIPLSLRYFKKRFGSNMKKIMKKMKKK